MHTLAQRFPVVSFLVGSLLIFGSGGAAAQGPAVPVPVTSDRGTALVPVPADTEAALRPGDVLILASWRCSYPRLRRVNEVALAIVESPLTRAVEEGRLHAWGQFNGTFRDEYNYHTFYVVPSEEEYRRVLGSVLRHMNQEAQDEMEEFYSLCDRTREVSMTVVTARQ